MPTGTRPQIGNAIFEEVMALTITPPASIATLVVTSQNVTVPGLLVNDFISWNLVATANNLVSIANMYVSAVNTLTIGWTTENTTISSLGAQTILVSVLRPENGSLGFAALPPNAA
jgi:hypothetical protein